MRSKGKGTKKAQNAKLNAPKVKIHKMMNRLDLQADPRQKACPRTNYLRSVGITMGSIHACGRSFLSIDVPLGAALLVHSEASASIPWTSGESARLGCKQVLMSLWQ
jgi:hypothetical protein